MGRYYLVADAHGWHRAVHRSDMSFDCLRAASSQEVMTWRSALRTEQHADLVRQWMLRVNDAPRSDEWIPAEWLLRAWESPAMAAAESSHLGMQARLFEIEAQPVVLARSIPVVIPELSLVGVDEFRVVREVPNWWLLGPCGREAFALLAQFRELAIEQAQSLTSVDPSLASLRMRALDVIDATARVGAYAIARAVIGEAEGRDGVPHELALGAAIGFVLKDVWPHAQRLYVPWVQEYGLPDLNVALRNGDLPYPASRAV
ncbi:hypothetical protein [Prauserella flavalba]|uniref:hypothetical protein n=1 Tax=Prauserella flavalba TaxID=1477506 RepID=UPI0036F10013